MKRFFFIGLLLGGLLFSAGAQEKVLVQGMAAYRQKDYQRAAALFAQRLQAHPDDATAWLWRGKALFSLGDEDAALTVLADANRLRPGYASLWMARVYVSTGDYDKAFSALEDHLASSWHRPVREIMLDTLLEPLEKDPRWREIWKRDWYTPREQAAAAIRGALALDDPATALREADAILAHYPEDPALRALRARACLMQGDVRGAQQDLKAARQSAPADTTVLYTAALLAQEEKAYDRMAETWEQLYHRTPGDFPLLLKISSAWLQAGDREKALDAIRRYREYFPEDIDAELRAGELFAAQGDYHNALRLLSDVVQQNPGDPYHFVARGDVYMKVHTYRYAIYDYGMALDLDPSNGEVYYSRAQAFLKTGDRKSACFDFSRALHYGVKKAYAYLQKYCGK